MNNFEFYLERAIAEREIISEDNLNKFQESSRNLIKKIIAIFLKIGFEEDFTKANILKANSSELQDLELNSAPRSIRLLLELKKISNLDLSKILTDEKFKNYLNGVDKNKNTDGHGDSTSGMGSWGTGLNKILLTIQNNNNLKEAIDAWSFSAPALKAKLS